MNHTNKLAIDEFLKQWKNEIYEKKAKEIQKEIDEIDKISNDVESIILANKLNLEAVMYNSQYDSDNNGIDNEIGKNNVDENDENKNNNEIDNEIDDEIGKNNVDENDENKNNNEIDKNNNEIDKNKYCAECKRLLFNTTN